MKDILIVVSPSRENTHAAYRELKTEADKYGKEALQILYTSYLLTGPKSFERAMSLVCIADRHGLDAAVFEIEAVLKRPRSTEPGQPAPSP
jgi:hypothetical protein